MDLQLKVTRRPRFTRHDLGQLQLRSSDASRFARAATCLPRTKTGAETYLAELRAAADNTGPLALRMDVLGMSLGDVIDRCNATGINSQYLIYHQRHQGTAKPGSHVKLGSVSQAFAGARDLAGIKGDNVPTFHEIRSLAKRLYLQQGGVDTKALLAHADDKTADLYADIRGLEPVRVRIDLERASSEQVLNKY